ncbi:hypothetical protein ACLB6K_20320 [Microcystis aeruginosa FACHB-524]|nr:hypothetical protein [Microcystis aeruginosa]ODV38130.1 hypothetical protein BFG60_2462 [Microcystis aeruginosa NIES-98]
MPTKKQKDTAIFICQLLIFSLLTDIPIPLTIQLINNNLEKF